MPVPELILQLIQRFEDNRNAYRSSGYNEAQLRQEFLNPFFEALGWDVSNKKGYTPHSPNPIRAGAARREIATADTQIDRLVYELYGFTEKEIKIVEGEI